jgi:hypothetical protein
MRHSLKSPCQIAPDYETRLCRRQAQNEKTLLEGVFFESHKLDNSGCGRMRNLFAGKALTQGAHANELAG